MNKFLDFISKFLKLRTINRRDHDPYLERYSILMTKRLCIYLHKFVGSDNVGFHDHPFRWHISIMLSGSYDEVTEDGIKTRHAPSIAYFDGNYKHRVIVNKPCYTLFIHGKRVKGWGFFTDSGYVAYSKSVTDVSHHTLGWLDAKRK